MSLDINIEHNFKDLSQMMDELGEKDVVNAARSALNNAVRRSKSQGSKQIGFRTPLKPSKIKKRINTTKARGGTLSSLNAMLIFSGTPIGIINFVVGNKNPISQKGRKVKRRRKLKARIRGSRVVRLNGAFIQDYKSKQVFRHVGKSRRMRKLSSKSLAKIVEENKIEKVFVEIAKKRFGRIFKKQLDYRFAKTSSKYSRTPLKMP